MMKFMLTNTFICDLDKGSRQSGNRPRINQDSDEDLPDIVKKGQNREGTISKPRARRESNQVTANRTPSLNKDKSQNIDGKRKLSQSPSLVNIPTQNQQVNSDDGGFDDDQ